MTPTTDDRATAVNDFHAACEALEQIHALAVANDFPDRRLAAHRGIWKQRLDDAGERYCTALRPVSVSRCPYTAEILALEIDLVGLDGPWWDLDSPRRPLPAALPATFVGFDGAVRLDDPPPPAPFLRRPGPQAPTVIERLLRHGQVTAVCSELRIGANPAWLIAYFAEPGAEAPQPPNDWGADQYVATLDGGMPWPVETEPEMRDANIAPWVEAGLLRWIAPGDEDLKLRSGLDGCPYLGLGGDATHFYLRPGADTPAVRTNPMEKQP